MSLLLPVMCMDGRLGKDEGGNSEQMNSDTHSKAAKYLGSLTRSQVSLLGFLQLAELKSLIAFPLCTHTS